MNQAAPQAVILTGVFGSGKSSVGSEIADLLEKAQRRYALLDLDFLSWFDAGDDGPTGHELLLKNLSAVVNNYLAIGVQYFVLAHSLRDAREVQDLKSLLPMSLKVARLTVPLPIIAERLSADPTTGRQDDLRRASEWLDAGTGEGFEDITVPNDRSIQFVAADILEWLGWCSEGEAGVGE
jgi:hypothetical protein